jgi:hypothetical protein
MAKPGWYNDNQFRDYPFVTRTTPLNLSFTQVSGRYPDISGQYPGQGLNNLPHGFIVDFGAIMDIDAEYADISGHQIYLVQLQRDGSEVVFTFHTNAPAGGTQELIFRRQIAVGEFKITWAEASSIDAEPFDPLICGNSARWRGFLVTGDLKPVADLLDDGESINFTSGLWQIEPARVQNLARSYLRAVNCANFPRVQALGAAGCAESGSSLAEDVAKIQSTCLSGPLVFKEGFNCGIRQDRRANAIIISAGVGLGRGQPCEEVQAFPTETKPPNSPFYSGGPACSQIIKSINGITGRNVTLVAGPGFKIYTTDDDPHQLIVDRALDDFALCLDIGSIDSSLSGYVPGPPPPPPPPPVGPLIGLHIDADSLSSSAFYDLGVFTGSVSADFDIENLGDDPLIVSQFNLGAT